MRLKFALLLGGLVPLAGCHLSRNVARNVYNEPAEIRDEVSVEKQLRKEARAAFAEVKRQYARRAFGDDFQDGFIDGYSDYLDNGGKAEMPAVPPLRYRRARFLNPEGHARIRDYFLGFKYGMDVAIATGCRPFFTYPVLMPEPAELPPLNITVLPPPPAANAPMPRLGAPLPLPKADGPTPSATPPAVTPDLGNPVTPQPGGTGTVPIPSGVVPKAPTPGPGGKSARGATDDGIVPVSGILIPIPTDTAPVPGAHAPAAPPPVFDLPDARPFR
jgi:hypothetical protein